MKSRRRDALISTCRLRPDIWTRIGWVFLLLFGWADLAVRAETPSAEVFNSDALGATSWDLDFDPWWTDRRPIQEDSK